MNKHTPLIISIPNPCHESWDEMTLVNGGRFCAHCNKKVTDFTNFTDQELYNFIRNNGKGCGRYKASQLNRPISIPYQPHSQLYRIAIAIGLTLIISQSPTLYAQNKPPLKNQTNLLHKNDTIGTHTPTKGQLQGTITKQIEGPAMYAIVTLHNNGHFEGVTATDMNGNYQFNALNPGQYEIKAELVGYDTATSTISVKAGDHLIIDFSLHLHINNNPENRFFTGEVWDPTIQNHVQYNKGSGKELKKSNRK